MRKEKGFTLIEIIAVLVILGILAAVAIPKYQDLQKQARTKALDGAFAAGASQLAMYYSKNLLEGTTEAAWALGTSDTLGDFTATITGSCGNQASSVEITATPYGMNSSDFASGTSFTKTYTICE